ncbi:hypothetical protein ACFFRR_007453 [Megaselia abdita]
MVIDSEFSQFFKENSKSVISNVRSQLAMNKFPRLKRNWYGNRTFEPQQEEISINKLVPVLESFSGDIESNPSPKDRLQESQMLLGFGEDQHSIEINKIQERLNPSKRLPRPLCLKPEVVFESNYAIAEEVVGFTIIPKPIVKEEMESDIVDIQDEDMKPVFVIDILKNVTACLEYFPMSCGTDKEIFKRLKLNFEDLSFELVSEVLRTYGCSCLLRIQVNSELTLWSSDGGSNGGNIVRGYIHCIKKAIRLLKTPKSDGEEYGTSKEIFTRFVKIYDSHGCIDFSTVDNLLKAFTGTHFQVCAIGTISVYCSAS